MRRLPTSACARLAVARPLRATPPISATEQSWHRRARRQRQQARAILAIASARGILASHHGGGGDGSAGMPNKGKKGHEHRLDALQRQLQQAISQGQLRGAKSGGGSGGGPSLAASSSSASWTCKGCGFFNFEYRRRCLRCKGDGPPSAPGHGQKGKSGPAHQHQGPGGKSGGGERADWKGKAALEAKVRSLEARLEAQSKSAKLHEDRAQGGGDDDDDVELLDDEADADGTQNDVENLPALQKTHEAMVAALGTEDPATKALKARIEAARAKQRASKPILQQVQQAQRRAGRLEKQLEAARKARADLEDKKADILAQIASQDEKVAAQKDELEKCKKELGDLLEKAKEEQGASGEEQKGPNKKGDLSLEGAADAWNRAKKAIEHRVLALPNEVQQAVGKQIQEHYATLESLLNQLPPAQTAAASATAVDKDVNKSEDIAAAAARQGNNVEHGTAEVDAPENEADEDDNGMLDLDNDTIQRLACALMSADGDAAASAGNGDGGDGGGGGGATGYQGTQLSAKQLHAARAVLGKKIPIRRAGKPTKPRGPKL